MLRILLGILISLLAFSIPTRAAWHEASSEHFVIYADQNAQTVELFAERLEKFHAAMTFMLGREPESPSASNRVTVFVVSNAANVRKLANIKGRYAMGVYRPLAGNIVAIVPKLRSGGSKFTLDPETILRHEYAHHFLFNISNRTFPLWFQEGFAEFYASGKNERDGTVILGGAANHRAYELNFSNSVPIETMLDTQTYLKNKSKRYDEFYGRSWLLYHYLSFDDERKGQRLEYEKQLIKGVSELDAARNAFGDLSELNRDLDRYQKKRRITAIGIPPDRLQTMPVIVRKLGDGEAEMMPVIMESRTGVDEEEALEVAAQARFVAARYPDDPAVQEALAEAEYDAGFYDETILAADRALALDPKRVRAQVQKIYAYASRAKTASDSGKAWENVRKQVVVANLLETNHPIPLIEYYKSYLVAETKAPEIAVDGVRRALEIAPFDHGLRMMVAAQYMEDKQYREAAATLRPLAYNPHRSGATEAAEQLLELAERAAIDKNDKSKVQRPSTAAISGESMEPANPVR